MHKVLTSAWTGICKARRNITLILAGVIVLVFSANSGVLAAGKVQDHGIFRSIEDDGTVVIDEKGYEVSPSLVVRDFRGDRISLRDLLPSSKLEFEYEYTTHGFVIVFMREIPQ